MNASLQQLIELVPPPANPVAPGASEEWVRVENEIGSRLPQDFKDYTKVYGAGQWLDFLGVMDPFYEWKHPQAHRSWREWIISRIGHLNELEEQAKPYYAPFKAYPVPNGLLAFGYDDNGGTLCWETAGNPNQWPIVCLDGKTSDEYNLFTLSLSAFLAGMVNKEIVPISFAPDLFPAHRPFFRSYKDE
jgi:hypothetical protein